MRIATRNGFLAGKSILPPGARWVEYLESTEKQWIDTGVVFSSNSGWDVTFMPLQNSNSNLWVMGTQNESGSVYGIRITSSSELQAQYGPTKVIVYGSNVGAKCSCVLDSTSLTLNDSSVIRSGDPGDFTKTITLFAWQWRNGGVAGMSHCRVCAARLYDNQALVRDFAPIAIGTTGYMLDLLTGDYLQYGNKGTGDFVIGPDIAAPVWGGISANA